MTFEFWLKVGTVCKEIIIPILIIVTIIKLNAYITYRTNLTVRYIKFIDGFVKEFFKDIKNSNFAGKVVNFKNNDSGGGEE